MHSMYWLVSTCLLLIFPKSSHRIRDFPTNIDSAFKSLHHEERFDVLTLGIGSARGRLDRGGSFSFGCTSLLWGYHPPSLLKEGKSQSLAACDGTKRFSPGILVLKISSSKWNMVLESFSVIPPLVITLLHAWHALIGFDLPFANLSSRSLHIVSEIAPPISIARLKAYIIRNLLMY